MVNPFPPGDPLHEEWERQEANGPEIHQGQLRMAKRLVRANANTLRYVHTLGWYFWDGRRWANDRDGVAPRAVEQVLRDAYHSLADTEPNQRPQLIKDIRRCESAQGFAGVLKLAGWMRPLATHPSQLDADPYLFNVDNGTLDLRTMALRPPEPGDLITKLAGCGYYPTTVGLGFLRFIEEILPEANVRAYVQRLFGAAMLGQVKDHVLPIFTGEGSNGKSTLVELVRRVFGDYAIAAEPDLLVDTGYVHPTGTADLLGVRLATTIETDEGRKLAAGTVKRLTGNDTIRARRMRQDFFEFTPTHTIIMVTNRLPSVRGDDPAIWRRIQVVPFNVKITNVDLDLPDKLMLEKVAVLGWIIAGHLAYKSVGLDPPDAVQISTKAYRSDSDAISRFLEERTNRTGSGGWVKTRDLWHAYRVWCEEAGEHPGKDSDFTKALRTKGFEPVHRKIGRVYTGLQLLTTDEEEIDEDREWYR